MKSSSAEPRGRTAGPGVLTDGAAAAARSARLDHPLRGGLMDPLYADRNLEDVVARSAEQAREAARAQGYAAGWSQGRQAAAQAALEDAERTRRAAQDAAELFALHARAALEALDEAARAQRAATCADLAEVGDAIADAAVALAASVLGRELTSLDGEVVEAVRTALRTLGTSDVTVVHVHPEDLRTLTALPDGVLPAGLRLEADPATPRGGALAVTSARQVLSPLPSALAAARAALAGGDER